MGLCEVTKSPVRFEPRTIVVQAMLLVVDKFDWRGWLRRTAAVTTTTAI